MPRQPLIRSTIFPYHVVNRTNNRQWFDLPLPTVWKILSDFCWETTVLYGARFHAVVLMANHFHALLSTPEADLGQVMQHLLGSATRTYNRISGQEGHLFNGRYRWSLVSTSRYYSHALKYVYRNPIKAGVVTRVEDYAFSTLHGRLGQSHLPFPLFHPTEGGGDALLPELGSGLLEWLNAPVIPDDEDAVQKALRRKVFELPRATWKRQPSRLETRML